MSCGGVDEGYVKVAGREGRSEIMGTESISGTVGTSIIADMLVAGWKT